MAFSKTKNECADGFVPHRTKPVSISNIKIGNFRKLSTASKLWFVSDVPDEMTLRQARLDEKVPFNQTK